ncbi:cysteine-rich receptor-like protein kinase 10 [Lolium rigidum]|uniref:cysteine-rich receptor-like protein kinase 10 n=1 Tax=Lolium rigidum TaxID=89674 RepID=UPI001F5DE2F6|nr:cysteine-rich receptor-like protein kinase 10 [Lolium rigidum]
MASHHLPSYLALLLAFILPPLAASQWPSCGKNGNFTTNSAYQANIRALSATLPKNASSSPTLFAVAAVGTRPDTVYALALCRGDANASVCGDCISEGFADAQKLCPNSKAATVYYDHCYVGFSSNQTLLSPTGGDNGALILTNQQNVTAPVRAFDAAVGALINATAAYAADNSSRRFGTGEAGFETVDKAKPKIYGLAQCRPDMAPPDCRSCLAEITTYVQFMSGKQGGRILGLRCNYRYEQYPFYTGPSLLQLPAPSIGAAPSQAPAPTPLNATPVSPTPVDAAPGSPSPPGGGSTGNGAAGILAITLPIVAAILASVVI